MLAVQKNKSIAIAQLLIEKGANVNKTRRSGYTALMFAVQDDNYEMAQLLIESGAWLNAARKDNSATALQTAAHKSSPNLVQLLINSGAKVNKHQINGGTALTMAMQKKKCDAISLLTLNGAYTLSEENGFYINRNIPKVREAKKVGQMAKSLIKKYPKIVNQIENLSNLALVNKSLANILKSSADETKNRPEFPQIGADVTENIINFLAVKDVQKLARGEPLEIKESKTAPNSELILKKALGLIIFYAKSKRDHAKRQSWLKQQQEQKGTIEVVKEKIAENEPSEIQPNSSVSAISEENLGNIHNTQNTRFC